MVNLETIRRHPSARVASSARIAVPGRVLQEGEWQRVERPTSIGANCEIRDFCMVGEEAVIGDDSVLDCYSWVDIGANVGARVLVLHRASVGARAVIGDDCVVAGLICERSLIENDCRVFGDLIHRQLDPTKPWDAPESEEVAPILRAGVFVGWGATVVGGVTVGKGTYVCAGATVTKEVGPGLIVTGMNQVHEPKRWRGALGKSDFFPR